MQLVMLFVQVGKQLKRKSSQKQPFLKIFSEYCQENTCVGVSFYKVAGLKICIFVKKETPAQLFPVNIAKF